jgi:hypothetical protein
MPGPPMPLPQQPQFFAMGLALPFQPQLNPQIQSPPTPPLDVAILPLVLWATLILFQDWSFQRVSEECISSASSVFGVGYLCKGRLFINMALMGVMDTWLTAKYDYCAKEFPKPQAK